MVTVITLLFLCSFKDYADIAGAVKLKNVLIDQTNACHNVLGGRAIKKKINEKAIMGTNSSMEEHIFHQITHT